MKYCTNCGSRNYDEAKFCTACGKPFGRKTPPHSNPEKGNFLSNFFSDYI